MENLSSKNYSRRIGIVILLGIIFGPLIFIHLTGRLYDPLEWGGLLVNQESTVPTEDFRGQLSVVIEDVSNEQGITIYSSVIYRWPNGSNPPADVVRKTGFEFSYYTKYGDLMLISRLSAASYSIPLMASFLKLICVISSSPSQT